MQLMIFIRAYLLETDGAMASVFLVDSSGAKLLGSSVLSMEEHSREDLCDTVNRNIQKLMENGDILTIGVPNWGSGLLQSLCHIRKQKQMSNAQHVDNETDSLSVEESENSRILSIMTSRDDTSHYLSFMNAVFAAQVCMYLYICRKRRCVSLTKHGLKIELHVRLFFVPYSEKMSP